MIQDFLSEKFFIQRCSYCAFVSCCCVNNVSLLSRAWQLPRESRNCLGQQVLGSPKYRKKIAMFLNLFTYFRLDFQWGQLKVMLVQWLSCPTGNTPDSKVYGANMGPSGASRTQLGPMLVPWTLLSGTIFQDVKPGQVVWIVWYLVDSVRIQNEFVMAFYFIKEVETQQNIS